MTVLNWNEAFLKGVPTSSKKVFVWPFDACRHIILCFRILLFPKGSFKGYGPTCWPDCRDILERAWRNYCVFYISDMTCIVAVSSKHSVFPTSDAVTILTVKCFDNYGIFASSMVFRPSGWLSRYFSACSLGLRIFLDFSYDSGICYTHRETWRHDTLQLSSQI